jgi:acyl-CoA synthetase (AMP-forming)/AMP-acid ligase II
VLSSWPTPNRAWSSSPAGRPTSAPDETALILYTSDTAGVSKGVELTGRNLGCALHEQQADIAGVLRLLVDRKVTHAVLVPTVLQRLLALPEAKTADWSALSYVVYGASPIPLPVLRDATEIIGCSFLQSYGLTESTGGFTLLGPGDHVPAEEFAHRLRSTGRPCEAPGPRRRPRHAGGLPGRAARRGPGGRLAHHEGLLAQARADRRGAASRRLAAHRRRRLLRRRRLSLPARPAHRHDRHRR